MPTDDPILLTGTLAKTDASATVTGTSTRFLSELAVGDRITVGGSYDATKTVTAIASDTSLTVDSNYTDTSSGEIVPVLSLAARFDESGGEPRVIINDQGSIGVGTLAPNASLDVSGVGAGDWRGCPVNLRLHTPEISDAWGLVMSTESIGPDSGVAIWLDHQPDAGGSTLNFTLVDADNNELDALKIDGTGITLQGGMMMTPTFVNGDYTPAMMDYYLFVDAGATGHTITLPSPAGCYGKIYFIYKTGGAGNVTIAPAGTDTINGVNASKIITTAYDAIKLVALPTTWVATTQPAA